MTTNKINEKGFYTENTDGTTNLVIDGNGLTTFNQPVSFSSGINEFAKVAKYQILALNNQQVSSVSYQPITVSQSFFSGSNYLNDIFDLNEQRFTFNSLNSIYTIEINFVIPLAGVNGFPVLAVAFDISGAIEPPPPVLLEGTIRKVNDITIRAIGSTDFTYFHGTYVTHINNALFVSGAQFYAVADSSDINLISGSILIKET